MTFGLKWEEEKNNLKSTGFYLFIFKTLLSSPNIHWLLSNGNVILYSVTKKQNKMAKTC